MCVCFHAHGGTTFIAPYIYMLASFKFVMISNFNLNCSNSI